jgi:excisionase family DNA binding protein
MLNGIDIQENDAEGIANDLPRLAFSIHETALMLGVCDKTIRRLIDRRKLKANRCLRHIRISRAEIYRFLEDETR